MRTKPTLATLAALLIAAASCFTPHRAFAQDATTTVVQEATTVTVMESAAAAPDAAPAAEAPTVETQISTLTVGLDTLWVLLAGALVFFMNTGFACVESGLCRSKNCVNILAKNFVVFACASLSFYFIGWNIMFSHGSAFSGSWFLGLSGDDNSPLKLEAYKGIYESINWTGVPLLAKFFFQLVFAGTAATIVSGAVAERIKFVDFVIFSFILVAILYPITGHWIWGAGWLAAAGFYDFAGSTVVHSVGGWAALAGIIVLGPRLGKFKDGKVHPIPGHNLSLATLGVFILWLGWFGFNPGSTMGVGDGSAISHVFVTTNSAAVAAIITSMVTAWVVLKKPDLSMILNGCLAGLVAITAPCAFVTVQMSLVIGAIAGVLVVLSVVFFDKIRIDDPVGALSVHLVNGIWGTLALGIFADNKVSNAVAAFDVTGGMAQFLIQLKGVAAVGAFTFVASLIVFYALKFTLGIRVSEEEEREGLDICEHGNEAYPDFQLQTDRMS